MSAHASGGRCLGDRPPDPTLRRASRMGHQHQQIAWMRLYKSLDAMSRVIGSDDRLLDPQAEFARHCGPRRVGRDHPPGGQRLPHPRKLDPVSLLGFAFNMQDIKMALGRDGETERVRESIQSGRREIGWMDDGSQ
jgi:hypothetical protein